MKFKKATSLFLAILVLFSSTHFALNIHSCHGMIAAVETIFESKTVCHPSTQFSKSSCCQNHQENKKCCSDDTIKASTDDVVMENSLQFQFVFIVSKAIVFNFYQNSEFVATQKLLSYYCDSNAPPLFKLYHQLVFYA
jgi:hypothetical protein